MKKLLVVAGAVIALQASAANAKTFTWSYTGPSGSGSGTFDATATGVGDGYTLNSITGTANGQTIVGLSDYDSPDNLIFSAPSGTPDVAVDTIGISFAVGDGTKSYSIYEDFGLYDAGSPFSCGGAPYCLLGPGDTTNALDLSGDTVALDSFTLTPNGGVPEPATWALTLLGVGGLGAALRVAPRKNAMALAAT